MNILLTSVGRRTYLVNYFKNAVNGKGKVFAANSVETYTLHQADDFIVTPKIYESDYINFLIDYCHKHDIKIIVSLFDIDLPVLAKNKNKFASEGINVIISDEGIIDICNDKWKTFLFLKENNIKTPETYTDVSEVKIAISNSTLKYPVIIKPRWGMGSIGIYKVHDNIELDVFYKRLKKDIFDSYLKYESNQDMNECIIFQECIDGEEYGLDIVNDLQSNYVTTICKYKLAMRSGETDLAVIVDEPSLINIGKKLAQSTKHIGNLDVDCFKQNDDYYVLEMNARFGGQYPFSHVAGVDLPKQIIKWSNGEPTDMELLKPKTGTKAFKDLLPVTY